MSIGDLTSLVADWPAERVCAAVTDAERTLGVAGDPEWFTRIASVAKLLVGMAALVAVEEGTVTLDEPAGPEGSTVRHLLSHASGLAFDGEAILAPPGRRRIYSNRGIERFAAHLADRAGMSFEDYLRRGVLEPLGIDRTELRGSPAHGVWSTVSDLLAFSRELLRPTLVSPTMLAAATRPQFPDLAGVLPDIGRFDPNPWGLTFDPGSQAAPLDRAAQLSGHVRTLRWGRDLPVGGSGRRAGDGRSHRPGLRALGPRGLAPVVRRGVGTLRPAQVVGSWLTVRTTFPVFCPVSTYRFASTTSSNG